MYIFNRVKERGCKQLSPLTSVNCSECDVHRTSRREHAAVRMPETASAVVVLDDTAEKCKPGLGY